MRCYLWFEAYQLSHGEEEPPPEDSKAKYDAMQAYWASFYDTSDLVRAKPHFIKDLTTKDAAFSGSHDAGAHACQSLGETTTVVSQRIGDKNITIFLNTLGRSGVVESRFEGTDFPQQMSGTGRQLPEDFVMRGFEHNTIFLQTSLAGKLLVRMREISNSLVTQHHEQSAVSG
jgi:hypothetical protein